MPESIGVLTGTTGAVTGDYSVRPAVAADTGRILDLVRRSLGEGRIPRDEAFWRWKHVSNPFGASAILVAERDADIIGLRVFMRWTWQSGGQGIRAVRAVDTATDPAWQGRGIFSRLTRDLLSRMRDDGIAFVFITPNQFSLPGYLKMGWVEVGRTSLWLRIVRPVRVLRQLRAPGENALRTDLEAGQDESSAQTAFADRTLESFLEETNRRGSRLSTRLSPAFLQWRYGDVPGFSYGVRWEHGIDGRVLVVYRRKARGTLAELRISELLAGDDARSRRLARRVLSDLVRRSGCDFASARARGPGARSVLASAGFLYIPRIGPTFTVRPLNASNAAPDPLIMRNWAHTIGDLELF